MAVFIGFAVHGLWIERSGGGFDIHCINGIKNLSFFQRRDHPIKTLGAGVLRMLRQLYKLVRLAMRGSLPLLALSLFIVPLNEGKGSEKDYEANKLIFETLIDSKTQHFSLTDAEAHADAWASTGQSIGHFYNQLAQIYLDGDLTSADPAKSRILFTKSIQNDPTAYAYRELGYLYMRGKGANTNFVKAKKNFEGALELKPNDSFSLICLADLYLRGLGVQRNINRAIGFLTKAGEVGDPVAMIKLSEIYELGLSVEIDERKALSWLTKVDLVTEAHQKNARRLGEGDPLAMREMREPNLLKKVRSLPAELGGVGRKFALFIGIETYSDVAISDLRTPQNDVRAIGELLTGKFGFEAEYLIDPKRSDITRALMRYQKELEPEDSFLLYFAGHGIENYGDGYWLPSTASYEDDTEWVSNDYVTRKLKALQATNVLVVSDSCFSGTLSRGVKVGENKSSESAFELFSKTKSRLVITSGNLTPVIDGGGGEHSLFARGLLESLTTLSGAFSATTLFAKIQATVVPDALSKGVEQAPTFSALTEAGHIGPDFVFFAN